jgi:photosystem II stability/assembly factor-like uncharacterized protein
MRIIQPVKKQIYYTLITILSGILLINSSRVILTKAQIIEWYLTFLPLVSQEIPPEWIGPGGGRIVDLVIDPNNPNIVYVGTWGAGVFKSTDGGLSWQSSINGMGYRFIESLEVAPNNPAVLYAGTSKNGVYKSADAGATWYTIDSGIQAGAVAYTIAIDPSDANRVYAGTRGISNNDNPPWRGVIYRSVDGGITWDPVLNKVGGSDQEDWAYSLAINPNNPSQVFAATHEHGVYRSNNYGESWKAANSGISDLSGRTIVVDPRPEKQDTVYLGVFRHTGVFKSNNGGESWVLKNKGINEARIYAMSIDPVTPDTLYLATFENGVMKSTSAGNNWFPAGLQSEIIGDVVVNPANNNLLLSATLENGLFLSSDGGVSWHHSQNGLNASTVTALIVSPNTPGTLYASQELGWVARSIDGGKSWADFNTNLNDKIVNSLVLHPGNPNLIFALTNQSGLYRCDLSSECWARVGGNLPLTTSTVSPYPDEHPFTLFDFFDMFFPDEESYPFETTAVSASAPMLVMAFAPSDSQIVYLGTTDHGIHKSIDGGTNWSPAGLTHLSIWSLSVDSLDANRLFAATDTPGIVKTSNDGGLNWSDSLLPDPTTMVYALTRPATISDTLYAGTSLGIYKYDNGTWQPAGLANTTITTLATHPGKTDLIFAGTNNGVFISDDGGQNWDSGPTELEGITIRAIQFDPFAPNIIYFCTQYHGILKVNYQ